jgi:DNA-directed RNA polymerase alpha subunit
VAPGGAIAGGLTGYMASESLKKSKPFAAVIAPIIAKLDRAADFQKFAKFLRSVEQKARHLAKYNEQFLWLNRALDWIIPVGANFNPDLLRRVDRLNLSSQALIIIRSDNIVYVGDLVQKTITDMMRFPNCTRSIVNEISESLAYIGLHFGMELKDWPPDNIEDLLSKIGQDRT